MAKTVTIEHNFYQRVEAKLCPKSDSHFLWYKFPKCKVNKPSPSKSRMNFQPQPAKNSDNGKKYNQGTGVGKRDK